MYSKYMTLSGASYPVLENSLAGVAGLDEEIQAIKYDFIIRATCLPTLNPERITWCPNFMLC